MTQNMGRLRYSIVSTCAQSWFVLELWSSKTPLNKHESLISERADNGHVTTINSWHFRTLDKLEASALQCVFDPCQLILYQISCFTSRWGGTSVFLETKPTFQPFNKGCWVIILSITKVQKFFSSCCVFLSSSRRVVMRSLKTLPLLQIPRPCPGFHVNCYGLTTMFFRLKVH